MILPLQYICFLLKFIQESLYLVVSLQLASKFITVPHIYTTEYSILNDWLTKTASFITFCIMRDNQPTELGLETEMFTKLETGHKKIWWISERKKSLLISPYLWNALVYPIHSWLYTVYRIILTRVWAFGGMLPSISSSKQAVNYWEHSPLIR